MIWGGKTVQYSNKEESLFFLKTLKTLSKGLRNSIIANKVSEKLYSLNFSLHREDCS